MRNYDYDLAKRIVEKLSDLDVLVEASMGMHEDWFCTAQTIWEDGEWKVELMSNEDADKMNIEFIEARKNGLSRFLEDRDEETGLPKFNPEYDKYEACLFGGLRGSDWATPVIQVELTTGETKTFNCFLDLGDDNRDPLDKKLEAISKEMMFASGCLSKPVQEARGDLDIEEFKG